jgi:hypothetical protein
MFAATPLWHAVGTFGHTFRVKSLSLHGLAFVVVHTSVGRAACRYGSPFLHVRFGHSSADCFAVRLV